MPEHFLITADDLVDILDEVVDELMQDKEEGAQDTGIAFLLLRGYIADRHEEVDAYLYRQHHLLRHPVPTPPIRGLIEDWIAETALASDEVAKAHPSFASLVALGPRAYREILVVLASGAGLRHAVMLAREIYGCDPVPARYAGRQQVAKDIWFAVLLEEVRRSFASNEGFHHAH